MAQLGQPPISSSTQAKVNSSSTRTYADKDTRLVAEAGGSSVLGKSLGSTATVDQFGNTNVPLTEAVPQTVIDANPSEVAKVDAEVEESNQGREAQTYTYTRYYLSAAAIAEGCCSSLTTPQREAAFVGDSCPVGWTSSLYGVCDGYGYSYEIHKCELPGQQTADDQPGTACS